MRCVFCTGVDMNVRYDRKGRPYLRCDDCSVTAFTRSMLAFATLGVLLDWCEGRVDWNDLRAAARLRLQTTAAMQAAAPAATPAVPSAAPVPDGVAARILQEVMK